MYGACCIGALVIGGTCASLMLDSGYKPFSGYIWRRLGSAVGTVSSAWPAMGLE